MLFSSEFLARLPYFMMALLPALTFHEWSHAFVATRFGDPTPRSLGRLTLNPLAHLDVFGTIVMLMAGFGWAKPVPVNPAYFKNSWAEFWVASAGPASNIILAFLGGVALKAGVPGLFSGSLVGISEKFLTIFIFMNLALAVFNLIPIGPLDGSHLLQRLLPLRASMAFRDWNGRMGGFILLGLVLMESLMGVGIIRPIIHFGVNFLAQILV